MKTTYLVLTLAIAIGAAGCSRTEAPKPMEKKSVAETYATQQREAAVAPPVDDPRPVSPDQIPNVGVAPAGQVAFGPVQPDSGADPEGDAWRRQYQEDRAKEVAARQATPPPRPASDMKKH